MPVMAQYRLTNFSLQKKKLEIKKIIAILKANYLYLTSSGFCYRLKGDTQTLEINNEK
jgi:hypothetical protein